MKIASTQMKGVCLLLLGVAITGGGRSIAADDNGTLSFIALADSSSATATDKAAANPFKDEASSTSAKTVTTPVESSTPSTGLPSCGSGSPTCSSGLPSWMGKLACNCDDFTGAPGRFWFRGEYVHWWTNGSHLPAMVAEEDVNGNLTTIFGDRAVGDGNHDGYRLDFGMWLDCKHCWGLEADYFDISGKPCNYDSGTAYGWDGNGNEVRIVRPVFDPTIGPTVSQVAIPTTTSIDPNSGDTLSQTYVGRITVNTNSYFQSAGIWLRRQLRACEWSTKNCDVNWTDPSARTFRLDAIGGYRFARLIDTVDERDDSTFISVDQTAGGPATVDQFSFVNSYRTVNNFNGAELGLNLVYTQGRWSVDVVTKAAIGATNQYVRLYNAESFDPSNTTTNPTPGATSVSQLQEFSRNRFSAIPELMVTVGYQLTDHLKFTVGYDLLYWSAVSRAADQIAVEPTSGYPYGTLSGTYTSLPPFTWNESYFLAQGLRLGSELRF